jgi:hypothetical protein
MGFYMITSHPWLAVPVLDVMQISFTPGPDGIAQSHPKTWISLMPILQKFQILIDFLRRPPD